MKEWPETLSAINDLVWQRLENAVTDRSSAWRLAQLATIDDGGNPTVRTLVVRHVIAANRTVDLHTDGRSRKVAEIVGHPKLTLHFWDPARQTQLRGMGTALLLGPAHPEADAAFKALPPGSTQPYRQAAMPGKALTDPATAIDAVPLRPVDDAFQDFRLVRIKIERIDFLWLRRGGQRRAIFDYRDEGNENNCWIGP